MKKNLSDYFKKQNGFYIDVGCHDPLDFQMQYLYKQGWRGINIDANEESIARFDKYRDRDINIRALISNEKKTLEYYYFNDHALNGVLENDRVEELLGLKYKIVKKNINTITLNQILEKYPPAGIVDFLNIDVEVKNYMF